MQTDEHQDDGPNDETGADQVAADIQSVEPSPSAEPTQGETQQAPPSTDPRSDAAKTWAVIGPLRNHLKVTNWIIALATVANVMVSVCQYSAIDDSNQQAKRSADAAVSAANIARDGLSETQKATRAADIAARAAEAQIPIQQRQLAISEVGAKASNIATDLQRVAANQTLTAFRQEQRAYVYPTSFRLLGEPDDGVETPSKVTVNVQFVNRGRTSAHGMNVRWLIGVSSNEMERPGTWDSPDASTVARVAHPDISMTVPIEYANFTAPRVNAYRKHLTTLYLRIRIDYRDVYNVRHWIETCVYHRFNEGLSQFLFCNTGNDFDRSQ